MAHGNENMKGKLCMVTGATSGIGRETARAIARTGAAVVVVGRNREKSEGTVNRIRQETGNPTVEYMLADLSSQAEIRQLAETFKRHHDRLDVLVNNAGGFFLFRKESVDGIEMFLALNHLAYFLLTNLLLDILKVSAPARIINVSSGSHFRAKINFDDLQNRRRYIGPRVYGQSKLANVLFTYELARRLEGTGITVNALHPGFVATSMGVNIGRIMRLVRPLMNLMAIDVEEGAKTPVYLATSPDVEGVTGKYFYQCRNVSSSEASYDEAVASKLWQASAEMTGLSGNAV